MIDANLLIDNFKDLILSAFLVFLRVGAIVAVLPIFGERSVPQRVRLAVAFSLTLLVFPSVSESLEGASRESIQLFKFAFVELVIGFIFGLIVRFFIFVLQMSGTISAQSTSLSQIFGNAGLEPLPAIGHLMVVGGLALAAITGLHLKVLAAIIGTYDMFPAGAALDWSLLAEWGVDRVSQAFVLAFTLSAPFIVASLLYNLMLGVINKAMPQLMVAFVGAPAITAGSLCLLALSLPAALSVWNGELTAFLANPYGAR